MSQQENLLGRKKLKLETGNIPGQFVLQSEQHSLSSLLSISNFKKKIPSTVTATSVNTVPFILAC